MTVAFDVVLVAVYLPVFALLALAYGKNGTLRPRALIRMALWPLELLWPFLIAAVAVLELCALLVVRRLGDVRVRAEQPST